MKLAVDMFINLSYKIGYIYLSGIRNPNQA